MSITVRRATLADLPYVDHVRRVDSEALGFLSMSKYEALVTGQGQYARPNCRLWLAEVDGEPVGFLYQTPGALGVPAKVIQIAVQRDARRREYGAALLAEAERYAMQLQRPGVALRVARDLESTAFWEAEGYELRALEIGGARRGRVLERRYKPLACGLWLPNEAAA